MRRCTEAHLQVGWEALVEDTKHCVAASTKNLFSVKAPSRVFRSKFLDAVAQVPARGELAGVHRGAELRYLDDFLSTASFAGAPAPPPRRAGVASQLGRDGGDALGRARPRCPARVTLAAPPSAEVPLTMVSQRRVQRGETRRVAERRARRLRDRRARRARPRFAAGSP
jgi:hypothetical protein